MSYAVLSDALEYAPAAKSAPTIKAQALLDDSADWVASIAPPPDPMAEDYPNRAARAEMRVFEYLIEVGNLKSKSLSGVNSKSFAEPERVKELVVAALGDYYKAPAESSNTAYVSSWPMARG
jgi:hypothetical protein